MKCVREHMIYGYMCIYSYVMFFCKIISIRKIIIIRKHKKIIKKIIFAIYSFNYFY